MIYIVTSADGDGIAIEGAYTKCEEARWHSLRTGLPIDVWDGSTYCGTLTVGRRRVHPSEIVSETQRVLERMIPEAYPFITLTSKGDL
jgi:hypothetical protein